MGVAGDGICWDAAADEGFEKLGNIRVALGVLLVQTSSFSGLWKGDGIPWLDNKRGVRMDGVGRTGGVWGSSRFVSPLF